MSIPSDITDLIKQLDGGADAVLSAAKRRTYCTYLKNNTHCTDGHKQLPVHIKNAKDQCLQRDGSAGQCNAESVWNYANGVLESGDARMSASSKKINAALADGTAAYGTCLAFRCGGEADKELFSCHRQGQAEPVVASDGDHSSCHIVAVKGFAKRRDATDAAMTSTVEQWKEKKRSRLQLDVLSAPTQNIDSLIASAM
jgi:hypothetical protein